MGLARPDHRPPGYASRPLRATTPDMDGYLQRAVDEEIVLGLQRGLNVLVTGPRGSGRTSTLSRVMWLAHHEKRPDADLVMVRARPATTAAELLGQVRVSLAEHDQRLTSSESPPAPASSDVVTGSADQLRLLGAYVAVRDRDRDLVIVVDDVDPDVGHQVFGVLRDDLWEIGAQWLVSVSDSDAPRLTAPPADAFFDLTLGLAPLTRVEAERLLKLRTGTTVALPAGDWTPRTLLRLAATTGLDELEDEVVEAARRQQEIAATLGRGASMVAAILEEVGPVSASDERVLQMTGWTRARVSQVLQQLKDGGFVTYTESRTGRPGRPVRLYELQNAKDAR